MIIFDVKRLMFQHCVQCLKRTTRAHFLFLSTVSLRCSVGVLQFLVFQEGLVLIFHIGSLPSLVVVLCLIVILQQWFFGSLE